MFRFNYQIKSLRRRALISCAAALFLLMGMVTHYGVILCFSSDGHTAFEKAAKRECCSSYKVCQSRKAHTTLSISKDSNNIHRHSGCNGCLDIPVVYIGTLPARHSCTMIQEYSLDSGSSMPSLHISPPEERTYNLLCRGVLPINTSPCPISTIVLLI